MSTKSLSRIGYAFLVIALLAAVALAPLPSMAQAKAAQKTGKALDGITKIVTDAKTQVEGALKALSGVTNAKDPKELQSNYKDFSKRVDNMVKAREQAQKGGENFKAQKEQYLQDWQKDMEGIQNPEIKATMEARKAKVQEIMESVKPSFEAARASFDPFMSDLVDTQKMLGMDLTTAGVAAASSITSKTLADGQTVVGNLDAVLQSLANVKTQLQ